MERATRGFTALFVCLLIGTIINMKIISKNKNSKKEDLLRALIPVTIAEAIIYIVVGVIFLL